MGIVRKWLETKLRAAVRVEEEITLGAGATHDIEHNLDTLYPIVTWWEDNGSYPAVKMSLIGSAGLTGTADVEVIDANTIRVTNTDSGSHTYGVSIIES